ncbi:MAG: hypothetical protein PS018_14730 [bacterium]|nr:hypothetical protein [bacterium]
MPRQVYFARLFRNEETKPIVTLPMQGLDEAAAAEDAKRALANGFQNERESRLKPTGVVLVLFNEDGSKRDLRKYFYQPDGSFREVVIEPPTMGKATLAEQA